MTHTKQPIRVRFAPSPTGYLHIGGLRSALFNWLFARHHNGTFMIRIEDTDLERSTPEYQQAILDSFAWVGITSDEPIVIQSSRLQEHKLVIEELLAQGKAYRCFCTTDSALYHEKDTAPAHEQLYTRYPGTCRTLPVEKQNSNLPHAVRFKVPHNTDTITFDDLIRGQVSFPTDQFDDFIIARSDGRPVYNFVVVVDDAYMRISHVIRGEEHISNTPKQLLLYQACNYEIPAFAHLPMILGPSGEKLSKRDGAVNVLDYKLNGFLPDALINYLARLGWAHGDQEIFTKEELIRYFSLEHVGKKGAIFDIHKLTWTNSMYIRTMSGYALYNYIKHDYMPTIHNHLSIWDDKMIVAVIDLYKERVTTIAELIHELVLVYNGPQSFDPAAVNEWITPEVRSYLPELITILQTNHATPEDLAAAIKELSKKLGLKFVTLAQPLRIALIGKTGGPGIFELLPIVGAQQAAQRLHHLLTLEKYDEKK